MAKKNGSTAVTLTKVAVHRCPGYAIGEPAPCYLTCECGWIVAVPEWAFITVPTRPYTCDCGIEYTGLGFITRRPRAA
jgi:hypothetical protein